MKFSYCFSDRITPYTSQSNIEVMLVQIAPQVSGQVIEVGAHDNERVKKGQLLYRIDPEPFAIALRAAEANLALVQQNLKVSTEQVRSSKATLAKQRTELATSKQLGGIVFDLTLAVRRISNEAEPTLPGEWWPIDRLDEAGLPTVFAKAATRALG